MDTATSAFGEKLKDQVEERLRFYEDGVAPRKNITVMQVCSSHENVCVWGGGWRSGVLVAKVGRVQTGSCSMRHRLCSDPQNLFGISKESAVMQPGSQGWPATSSLGCCAVRVWWQ